MDVVDGGAPGRAESLDVPVGPVGGPGRRGPGRGAAVALVAGLAIAGSVALALLDGRSRVPPSTALVATGTAVAPPSSAPPDVPTAPPAADARPDHVERMPEIGGALQGAPVAVFHRRAGTDLERLAWAADGSSVQPLATVPNVFAGIRPGERALAVVAPDALRIAVRTLGSAAGERGDVLRVATSEGQGLWTRDDGEGVPVVPIWSPDGRRVLVPGSGGSWRILGFDHGDDAVTEVTVRAADLRTWAGPRALAPLGFSADARWVYAAVADGGEPGHRPVVRIDATTGDVEGIEAVPRSGAEAVTAEGRTGYALDPLTGRRFLARAPVLSTAPTIIRVIEADGHQAFAIRLETVVGIGWAGDGRLVVLETDRHPRPTRLRLVPVDAGGRIGAALLEAGPLGSASLAGVRDGHALLALVAAPPAARTEFVMVRLSDGATATLAVDPAADLQFGGWLPRRP